MAAEPRPMQGPFSGLSVKLIATIVVVILLVEVLIYLPSIANYRSGWIDNRLRIGIVAGRVLDAVPDVMALPPMLADRLLGSAGAYALVYRRNGQSQLIEAEDYERPEAMITADMRDTNPVRQILDTLDTILFGGERTLRIVGDSDGAENAVVEVLMPERPLRNDLFAYSRNIVLVSLTLSALTALILYVFLSRILIAPIRRVSASMVAYRQAPENAALIITPHRRNDEIGVLEAELAAMEADIFSMLRQRRHLADLGLAVAKINHDLRNMLTSAQLLSDQVVNVNDPKVQRLAPRLVNTLDKAIGFVQSVLDYGRQSATPPRPVPVDLRALVDESALDAGLAGHPAIVFENGVPDAVTISADPDQLGRVFVNLIKNAREALEEAGEKVEAPRVAVDFSQSADVLLIGVSDNGPGLPPRARENLFVAFEGSARAGGTGLGLAIARELTEAHGGRLSFVPQPAGTRFELRLPATMLLG
jgi:signal transduction histidine kinase